MLHNSRTPKFSKNRRTPLREKLEQNIDRCQFTLKQENDSKNTSAMKKVFDSAAVGATSGGLFGLKFGIIPGALTSVVGAVLGAAGSYKEFKKKSNRYNFITHADYIGPFDIFHR